MLICECIIFKTVHIHRLFIEHGEHSPDSSAIRLDNDDKMSYSESQLNESNTTSSTSTLSAHAVIGEFNVPNSPKTTTNEMPQQMASKRVVAQETDPINISKRERSISEYYCYNFYNLSLCNSIIYYQYIII